MISTGSEHADNMRGRRVIVVTGKSRPHELLLLAYGAIIGAVTLLGERSSIALASPTWAVYAWSIGLVISGVLGIGASLWRTALVRALEIERGALLIGAGAILLYSGYILTVGSGWDQVVGAGMVAAWGAANIWRSWQITVDLHRILTEGQNP